MMDQAPLHYQVIAAISAQLRLKSLSPVELVEASLVRISLHDASLQSFITVLTERARNRAHAAEREIAQGHWRGPLHGVPIALKDMFDLDFAASTAGMPMRIGHVADRTATVVERLEKAGAIILGTLAVPEGIYIEHRSPLPMPRNPWSADHWTGASSSGAAVAVAAGLCFGALGSDTGGSIRTPSSACGLTGLKPTWGRVSRAGVFPLAPSMDHVGPMARCAADAAILLGAIAGPDLRDPTALQSLVPNYFGDIADGIEGVVVGIDEAYVAADTDPLVVDAVQAVGKALAERGARLKSVSMPDGDALARAWFTLCSVEAVRSHRNLYPDGSASYGPAFLALLDQGAKVGMADLLDAQELARLYAGRLAVTFSEVDLLIVPALLDPMFRINELPQLLDRDYGKLSRFQAPFDITGHPTITLPAGFDPCGVPIGVQLIGCHLDEALLLRAGHAFQQASDWHLQRPNRFP